MLLLAPNFVHLIILIREFFKEIWYSLISKIASKRHVGMFLKLDLFITKLCFPALQLFASSTNQNAQLCSSAF